MILPLRVLGRASANWILSGVAMGPISLRTWSHQVFLQFVASPDAGFQGDEGVDALPLISWGMPHDRGLGHLGMADQGALHLGGADAVAGDVDDVVDAAHEPVVAVLISPGAVAGEVHARELDEVGLLEAVVVSDRSSRIMPGQGFLITS